MKDLQKLSVLTFSRNDIKSITGLVKEVYEIADEIVLVDSSDRKERLKLLREKKRLKLGKLRIFYAIPLGLVELYRPYGLSKCRNDWVLYLDSDERLNEEFKRDIRQIISKTEYDAFAIKRYEYVGEGGRDQFFTWNTRLYKKDKVLYRGIVHEQPIVNGRTGTLQEGKYYMENRKEYHNPLTGYEFDRMLPINRMSYGDYNRVLVEHLVKMTAPGENEETFGARALMALLLAYERIAMKKQEEELSGFDYFVYNFTKSFFIAVRKGDLKAAFTMLPGVLKSNTDRVREQRSSPHSEEDFEISKIVTRQGMVSFLGLDKPETIENLNRKYKDGKLKGADLLMHLLRERYEQSR